MIFPVVKEEILRAEAYKLPAYRCLDSENSTERACVKYDKGKQKAFERLQNFKDIVIKQAHNGSGIVVQSNDSFIRHGEAHVRVEKTYAPLLNDPTLALTKKINETLESFSQLGLIDKIEDKSLLRSDETVRYAHKCSISLEKFTRIVKNRSIFQFGSANGCTCDRKKMEHSAN